MCPNAFMNWWKSVTSTQAPGRVGSPSKLAAGSYLESPGQLFQASASTTRSRPSTRVAENPAVLRLGVVETQPDAGSHPSAVQASPSSHASAGPPTQAPALHVSLVVQAFPSSQAAVLST
jgi:hypothetical protein